MCVVRTCSPLQNKWLVMRTSKWFRNSPGKANQSAGLAHLFDGFKLPKTKEVFSVFQKINGDLSPPPNFSRFFSTHPGVYGFRIDTLCLKMHMKGGLSDFRHEFATLLELFCCLDIFKPSGVFAYALYVPSDPTAFVCARACMKGWPTDLSPFEYLIFMPLFLLRMCPGSRSCRAPHAHHHVPSVGWDCAMGRMGLCSFFPL